MLNLNWSGWWFRHICRAADILQIPCPDQRFADQDQAWDRWGQTIDAKLEHLSGSLIDNGDQIIRDWERPPFYMGNRFPGTEENLCECSVPLPPESIALAQLAEQASRCDKPEEIEIPAVLLGTYF